MSAKDELTLAIEEAIDRLLSINSHSSTDEVADDLIDEGIITMSERNSLVTAVNVKLRR